MSAFYLVISFLGITSNSTLVHGETWHLTFYIKWLTWDFCNFEGIDKLEKGPAFISSISSLTD